MEAHWSFCQKALDHIHSLVGQIGARPAGSHAESQAREYVANQLRIWGYTPIKLGVHFSPHVRFEIIPFAIALSLITSATAIQTFPEIVIWLPVCFILIPNITRWMIRRRKRTETSENVFSSLEPETEKPTLIICAHLDTAPVHESSSQLSIYLNHQTMNILQRTAFLVSILAGFHLFHFFIPIWLFWGVRIVCLIVAAWYLITYLKNAPSKKSVFSPGAIDNASGVALNLALAEYFSTHQLPHLRLGFLFTGAEETGLHGAEDFAKSLAGKNFPLAVLNLDMVGAGHQLCLVTKVGVLFPIMTTPALNELMLDVEPSIQQVQYTLRAGDFLPFLKWKIPAISLETRGSKCAEMAYHTIKDTTSMIDPLTLEMTADVILKFIHRLPYSDWAVKKRK
jgi:hypothetical protein